MSSDRQARQGVWTLMLADVVALMLAFFVLGFSMRVMLPTAGAPLPVVQDPEAALAALERWAEDSHTTAERPSGPAPPFAYLAAILGDLAADGTAPLIRHDGNRLVVVIGSGPPALAAPDDRPTRDLLLNMAFLARRFGLALSLTLPGPAGTDDDPLQANLALAAGLQAWLSRETRHAPPEVVVEAAAPADRASSSDAAPGLRIALVRRPLPASEAARP